MQKKYIALAVAALASGAAFAQTSVVFGGIVDMGYAYSSKHTDGVTSARSAIDEGGQDSSRLFWTATEDLGNGLSVSAKQELRMAADRRVDGVKVDSTVLTLAGKSWGAVRAGNYGSASDDIAGFSESGGMGFGNGALDLIVIGTHYNVIGYVTPAMGGFQAKVNYSTNDKDGNDLDGNGDRNIRAYSVNAAYQGMGLKLGAAYQQQSKTISPAADKKTEWTLVGGYTFGQFSVGAGYDRTKTHEVDPLVRKAYRLTAGMAITPNDQVALSYAREKFTDSTGSSKASGVGVSYSHMLSKRTNVYATYGKISSNNDTGSYDGYKSKFKVGLRHQF